MSRVSDPSAHSRHSVAPWFATTQWDCLDRTKNPQSTSAASACEHLCRAYWGPIYNFIRHQGYSPENAEDLTQSFILMLLQKNFWERADRGKGRFRNLLLKALNQFLLDEKDRANALKRGKGITMISMDDDHGSQPPIDIVSEGLTPEDSFNQSWALSLMNRARSRLRLECKAAGKSKFYDRIDVLAGGREEGISYAEVARDLGLSVSAVKSGVSRLRSRFAELVREEVEQTVVHREEVDDEIQFLLKWVSS